MAKIGLERQITGLLDVMNRRGGYPMSLVCTDQGLLVASAGDELEGEILAGLTSLFDDIVLRAERDLGVTRVDEVTLADEGRGRIVIRPIPVTAETTRFFLVARVPADATWRRNTTLMCKDLGGLLRSLGESAD